MKSKTVKNHKHNNQVRIIGGQCRGRKLAFTEADGLRPTPDMVREKVFNWLGQDLTGKRVLDLFAGSGALGLEAASRNAAQVLMVDNNRQTINVLQDNIRKLQLVQIETSLSDGLSYLQASKEKFDVVFLDPPFAWQQWQELFALLQERLTEDATVYIEAGRLPDLPSWLVRFREGQAGMSKFALLLYKPL